MNSAALGLAFDYIVVGSGASGGVLAAALAAKGPTLLVERGPNNTAYPQSAVPQGWPQISVIAAEAQRAHDSGMWTLVPAVLGGGSALNGAVCWRGEVAAFEALGFSLRETAAAFESIEAAPCAQPAATTEYTESFAASWAAAGLGELERLSSGVLDEVATGLASWAAKPLGVQQARSIYRDGVRQPTDTLFTDANTSSGVRTNLTVLLGTRVRRILFDGTRAAGVEAVVAGFGKLTLRTRRGGEVLLSAGAFETPKLLMLSGVGPATELNTHGIPIVAENEGVGVVSSIAWR